MDARFHSRIETRHRALGFSELLSKLDFQLCNLLPDMCDSGKDVTRQQAQCELVRVVNDDRVVDRQSERDRGRYGRRPRTGNV